MSVQRVYKTVFNSGRTTMSSTKLKENVQNWLLATQNDPIAKILLKTSNLTKTQLETLLIDILAENHADNPLNYDEKGRLRLTKAAVSRGSFNRTLAQAKKNVTESIYTILLLGYLGIMESTSLAPYQEAANKLQKYTATCSTRSDIAEDMTAQLNMITLIREEITTLLEQLTNPKKNKEM